VTSALDLHRLLRQDGALVVAHAARLLLVVVVAVVVRSLLLRGVRRLVRTAVEGSLPRALKPLRDRAFEPGALLTERRRLRAGTLGSVLRSVVTAGVATVAGAMALSELGLDLTPVVASAGIVGVAIGFGAQNLVKDFLTGMFMLLEDQYGVGDVIDAGPASGTVEAVGLRTTRLRDVEGTVWHIRNGEITRVGNKGQGWARAMLDVPLSLDSDVAAVRRVALSVAESVWHDDDFTGKELEQPAVWGGSSPSAPTACCCGWSSRPRRWSSGPWRGRSASGSSRRSTLTASRSASPPGASGRWAPASHRRQRRAPERITPVDTLYDAVGGEPFFRALVDRFYEGVAMDPLLRPLYPEQDLTGARERLALFLSQYWGGPTTYSDTRGHPRLRMRHAGWVIGERERDAWIGHMRAALSAVDHPPEVHDAVWGHLESAAHSLVNAPTR